MMICQFPMETFIPEMEFLCKTGSKTILWTILVSLIMIETTTYLPDKGQIWNKDEIPVIVFSSETAFKMMLCLFLMKTLILEMESLCKTGSKTIILTILVSLMMIDTTTALSDEGQIQNKDDRPVILLSSKHV